MRKQMEIGMDDIFFSPFHIADFMGISLDEGIASSQAQTGTEQIREQTLSRHVTIRNEHGLHARPASKIASMAQRAKSNVWIIKDDKEADAKSMICILMLACEKGSRVIVKADDLADFGVLDDIVNIVENGCGEESNCPDVGFRLL